MQELRDRNRLLELLARCKVVEDAYEATRPHYSSSERDEYVATRDALDAWLSRKSRKRNSLC